MTLRKLELPCCYTPTRKNAVWLGRRQTRTPRLGGIHIYGGDFFATERSQWDPETLQRQPSDGAVIRAMFERENKRYRRLTD